jgi:hypothetical protein
LWLSGFPDAAAVIAGDVKDGMERHVHLLSVAAVVLAVALGAGAAAVSANSFPDPVGDVTGGAGPDLVGVSAAHTASTVTFRFRFAKAPPLGMSVKERWVDMLLIGIDVPPRSLKRGAHGWTGLDYYAGLHGADRTAVVVKASPTKRSQPGKVLARPKVRVSGSILSFSISRRALGNPDWIEFVVAAGRETSDQANGGSDEAPDRGTFHHRLTR